MFKTLHNLHYEQIGKEVRCIEDELPFEIPDSWEWTRLNEIRIKEIKRGKSPKYATEGNVLVFAQKCNTKYNGIDISLSKYLDSSSLERYDDSEKMVDGDIVINSTGTGTMGRIGYYSANSNPNNYILVPDSHVTIVRVSAYLNSRFIKNTIDQYHDYFEKHGEGSTNQKELKPITIQNILIPIPPKSEQIKIIKTIDKLEPLIEEYKHVEEKLYELNSNIKEQLKKSILQYAIEGKLVPQNPNDEPASALLERIHKEKEKLIADGKIKKDKNESIIYRRDNSYYEKLNNNEKCIDEEVLYSIPNSWSFTRQSTICWLDNGTPSKGEKLPYLEAKVIRSIKKPEFKLSGVIVDKTDKVILVDGENSGEIFNIPYKGYMGSTFKLLRQSSLMSEDYIQFIFELYRDLYKNNKKGAAIPHLDKELFKTLLIPIPPVKEQNRIVDSMFRLRYQIELL